MKTDDAQPSQADTDLHIERNPVRDGSQSRFWHHDKGIRRWNIQEVNRDGDVPAFNWAKRRRR